jgi:amino acid transporter
VTRQRPEKLGLWAVAAIGVGGMVGGGIFAVLGLAVQLARGGAPVAFLIAGAIALLTSYSYARLSVSLPSRGGTVEFLNQAFGKGLFSGSVNVLLALSYVVMLSLYSHAFGSYAAGFLPAAWQPAGRHAIISAVITVVTALNVAGSHAVGEAEEWIVGLKIAILLLFVAVGLGNVDAAALAPEQWSATTPLIAGGMIIFLAYEGFELIANTAEDVSEPGRTLPRAYYASVLFVIVLYMAVAAVTVGNLSVGDIVAARDYALAEAARPFLGQGGFVLIAIAAMLSTGSALNATLYGAARVNYIIARDGELPAFLERKVWSKPIEGLLITAALTLLIANLVDLSSIAVLGSAGFLLAFAAVNAANVRLHRRTSSQAWISAIGCVACLAALGTLVVERALTAPGQLWVLATLLGLAVGIEAGFRAWIRRNGATGSAHLAGRAGP